MKLSISNLEQLSGVPAHTIRIWERRYKALKPLRSAGNTRYYTDGDLRRLLNIVSLNEAGLKISQACALAEEQVDHYLSRNLKAIVASGPSFEYYISQLLHAGIGYQEVAFKSILSDCFSKYGVEKSYTEVVLPLLQRVGLMWRRENICPAQEHFISGIIRQKLMVAIDAVALDDQVRQTWLLFLPEDEGHDIALLFASYLLRSKGFRVVYLGERVPLESAKDAYKVHPAHNVMLFMIRQRPVQEADYYLAQISEAFAQSNLYIAGNTKLLHQLNTPENITVFQSIEEFQQIIAGHE